MWFVTACAAATVLAFGVASALTGGFELLVAGARISVRHPWQPFFIGGVLAGAAAFLASRDTASRRVAAWLVPAACAIVLLLVLVTRGVFVAGGADSSGYVSQAELWQHGTLRIEEPLVRQVDWPHKRQTFAPLGYRPSPDGNSLVPSYPPGLPMLMALGRLAGGEWGGYLVVPLMGLLVLAMTAWAAHRIGGAWAAAFASVLITLSPTFLHQVVQPMSDVPAASLWTLALLGAWQARGVPAATGAGLAAAAATLVRPNLFPLAALVVLMTAVRSDGRAARVVATAAAASIGAIAVGLVQWQLYGSPFASGYGSLARLFSIDHVVLNLTRYPRWLAGAEPILLAGGLLAPLVLGAAPHGLARSPRLLAVGAASMFAGLVAIYLTYLPFDDWTYLRFLLPAFPVLAATAGAAIARPVARRVVTGIVGLALIAGTGIALCRAHDALGAKRLNTRYLAAARYVNTQLPADAVLISSEQSGALRYYTRRTILRFDLLSPGSLDPAIEKLTLLGRPAYLVLDAFEIEAFRRRFGHVSALGRLEQRPREVIGRDHPVYVFDPK
jgi:hypothetical protein